MNKRIKIKITMNSSKVVDSLTGKLAEWTGAKYKEDI